MQLKTSNFQVTPAALLFDPEIYLFDFNKDASESRFLIVKENTLSLSPFTDIRFEPLALGQFTIATKTLFELESSHNIERPDTVFIFHHAFVCSTLLARCLGQIDAFFSLKEPWILRRLADYKRQNHLTSNDMRWQLMLKNYLSLLAKNYSTGNTLAIKATNVANNLISDIFNLLPRSKILYLYSDLQSFLISNLKKTQETKQKIPALVRSFLEDSNFSQLFPKYCQLEKNSFLQNCALLWLVNLYNFKQYVGATKCEVHTLEMSDFLAQMDINLIRLCHFFGHRPKQEDINKMLAPEITQTNAKQSQARYNTQSREAESQIILKQYHSEIHTVLKWAAPIAVELELLEFLEQLKLGRS